MEPVRSVLLGLLVVPVRWVVLVVVVVVVLVVPVRWVVLVVVVLVVPVRWVVLVVVVLVVPVRSVGLGALARSVLGVLVVPVRWVVLVVVVGALARWGVVELGVLVSEVVRPGPELDRVGKGQQEVGVAVRRVLAGTFWVEVWAFAGWVPVGLGLLGHQFWLRGKCGGLRYRPLCVVAGRVERIRSTPGRPIGR
ncbi:hypothetical protein IWX64_003128 [Arthrobacter sp. CAN_A212]|uniref:hypothetical protein n=1 Tax=Arthrobacter sp. CAN_A212 TaxID=2787719 RepID=UPI0018C96B00